MNIDNEFAKHAAGLGASLNEMQIRQLIDYGNELERVNETMNLTRIPASDYLRLHVLDSLSVASAINLSDATSLLDIGTGAGFPAIPLAVAFPNLQVVAMDARNKKLEFIKETAAKLRIKNIKVQHARAEQLASEKGHKIFDVVTSRALASYQTLIAWQLPFVGRDGSAVMLKSTAQYEEISGTPPPGWQQTVKRIALPGTSQSPKTDEELERLLVILKRK